MIAITDAQREQRQYVRDHAIDRQAGNPAGPAETAGAQHVSHSSPAQSAPM
jgi:hypothetical protein